jgi:hypothetical protein
MGVLSEWTVFVRDSEALRLAPCSLASRAALVSLLASNAMVRRERDYLIPFSAQVYAQKPQWGCSHYAKQDVRISFRHSALASTANSVHEQTTPTTPQDHAGSLRHRCIQKRITNPVDSRMLSCLPPRKYVGA